MFQKSVTTIALLGSLFVLQGCSTLADSRAEKGTGKSREYSASFDRVWKVVPGALSELSLPMVADNKQEGYFLAQRGMSAFSYGENVAIFVEPAGATDKTRVEVVSKKTLATTVFATDWSMPILDKIGQILDTSTAQK